MKVWVLSDLHIEFEPFIWPNEYADIIILAGDISTGDPTDFMEEAAEHANHILYVPGNHEFYGHEYHSRLEFLKSLPCITLSDRIVEIDGITFAGTTLWTDFNGDDWFAKQKAKVGINDFYQIMWNNRKFHPDDTVSLNYKARSFLYNSKANVFITHHLPDTFFVEDKYKNDLLTPAFANTQFNFQHTTPKLWIFGHTHYSVNKQEGDVLFICNPKGYYDENNGFNPTLMVDI